MICKCVSPFLELSFHSFGNTLWSTEVFLFWRRPVYLFSLVACSFGVLSQRPLPSPRLQRFIPVFSCKIFIVSALIFKISDPFWVHFCIGCEVGVQLDSSACGDPFVPAPLLKKTVLSPLSCFVNLCQNSVGYKCVGLLLDFQFRSFNLIKCPDSCQHHTVLLTVSL